MTDIHSQSDQSFSPNYIEGRFLDGQLSWLLTPNIDPGPGYSIGQDGRVWRNGDHVGWARRATFDREVLGWWVEYWTWPGSPLDLHARREAAHG